MCEFMETCPEIKDLFFNFSESKNSDISIVTIPSEGAIEEFIDGSSIRYYEFAINCYKTVSTLPNSQENAIIMFDVDKVASWIRAQNKANNYPNFGILCQIQELKVLQDIPTVAGQNQNEAKYMFACRVEYYQESED